MGLSYFVRRDTMDLLQEGVEVEIVTKNKKISFRLDDNTAVAIEQLKEAMEKQMLTEVTDAQVIRSAIAFYYNTAVANQSDQEDKK